MMDDAQISHTRVVRKLTCTIRQYKLLQKSNNKKKAQNSNDAVFKNYIKDNHPEIYGNVVKFIIKKRENGELK